MNKKTDPKQESVKKSPLKPAQQTTPKEEDGWFARHKNIIAIVIATLVIVAVVAAAWWYFSVKMNTVTVALQTAEHKIDALEQKIETITQHQKDIIARLNELNESQLPSEDSAKSTNDNQVEKSQPYDDRIDGIGYLIRVRWYVVLGIVILIAAIIYLVIIKIRKKEQI